MVEDTHENFLTVLNQFYSYLERDYAHQENMDYK